jgi:hypothetical protein
MCETENKKDNAALSEEVFKQLYLALYEYRIGRIRFLELLDRWKGILHLPPSTNE